MKKSEIGLKSENLQVNPHPQAQAQAEPNLYLSE